MGWNIWRLTVRLACLLAVALILPRPISAATMTVTDLGDTGAPGQLRTLINAAAPGDTTIIPAGTINLLAGVLAISKSLTIQGAGAGVTIIDGGRIDGVFNISSGSAVAISGLSIRNGKAAVGGGILNAGTATLTNVTISGNTTGEGGGQGGGIHNAFSMTLTNVAISGNTAGGFGGGISNARSATLTNVTISGNTAPIGGGLFNEGTAMTLTNVTISGNTANEGGGIDTSPNATLTNVTIVGNTAGVGGGISYSIFFSTAPTAKNTIVANNGFSDNCRVSITSIGVLPITSLGHNLDSGTTCAFTGPGDLSNTDPKLGPLQNNGGFTLTHALLTGSPAIDAGDNNGCPSTDQRGIARPQGLRCDIGAFEFGVIVAAVTLNGSGFRTSQTITYQATLNPGLTPTQVDIYLGCLLPHGVAFLSLVQSAPGVISIALGPAPVPFLAGVTLAPLAVAFSFTFAGTEPPGTYFTYAGLAVAGSNPFVPTNQLSLGIQAFQFTP